MCIYLLECFCVVFQTTCRQSRTCPVQTESALTVPFAETKPQGNTTEPPAVTAAKASSDAPYARATSTPAGTDDQNIYGLKKKHTAHVKSFKRRRMNVHKNMLLRFFLTTYSSLNRAPTDNWLFSPLNISSCYSTLLLLLISFLCSLHAGSAGSALWIKIRGTSVVSADSTNASGLAWRKKVWKPMTFMVMIVFYHFELHLKYFDKHDLMVMVCLPVVDFFPYQDKV